MTAVQFNKQQINFFDFPKINLDDIDERCGEVYITLNGTLVFHCLLCARDYGGIDNFLDHLASHYKDVQEEKEGKSDSDILLEDFRSDIMCKEQKLVKVDDASDYDATYDANDNDFDVSDNDIDEFETILQSKEAASLQRINFEHIVAESKEPDAEKIKVAIEIKEDIVGTWNMEDYNITEPKRYQKKVGDKWLMCKECGKRCKTMFALRRHYSIHSDERKYKCKICDSAFRDRGNCIAHVRRIHLGTRRIECGYCPKTFFSQNEVTTHRRTHTGERPFACTTCGKSFAARKHLNTHMKYHNSEPTFKCSYCEKSFYEKLRYEDHMLVHTKKKKFVCEICAATFPRHSSWLRHSKMHKNSTK